MLIKLELIQQKYALTTEELAQAVNKLFKRRLQVPKKIDMNRMLLEDLRLYAIAIDSIKSLQSYYTYEVEEVEKKHLERYDNKTKSSILDLGETKKLLLMIQKEKGEESGVREDLKLQIYSN